jgi:type IV fimbrial biogenesis protein FimT
MRTHGWGFTLIELLVAMSILALLLAAPSFSSQIEETRQHSRLFELRRLVQLARSNALSTGKETTICGTTDGSRCVADWTDGTLLIFEDRDRNRALGNGDRLVFQSRMSRARWHWRGSNRPYLRFAPTGAVLEKGHFTLCPNHGDVLASQLIVNWVGRVRVARIPTANLPASESCG